MVEIAEGYKGWHHLVWRNLIGFIVACAVFAGIWFGFDAAESWNWIERIILGLILAPFSWFGVMFITAKGY